MISNKLEAQIRCHLGEAYVEILQKEDINIPPWFSFSSKDGMNVVSGDSIVECAAIAESCKYVAVVGLKCTPRFIHDLISTIKKKTIGEADEDFVPYVHKWHKAGASLVDAAGRLRTP